MLLVSMREATRSSPMPCTTMLSANSTTNRKMVVLMVWDRIFATGEVSQPQSPISISSGPSVPALCLRNTVQRRT